MKIAVLGAGVVGVTSAWYLARAGHEVTVVDRQDAAAMETSYRQRRADLGQPRRALGNPATPKQVLKWLGREDSPMLFRLRADPYQWAWGLSFLRECLPARTRANAAQIAAINRYSRGAAHRAACRNRHRIRPADTRHPAFFSRPPRPGRGGRGRRRGAAAGHRSAGAKRGRVRCARARAVACAAPVAGGVWATADESGDAHKFTQELARLCAGRGVQFRYGSRIEAHRDRGRARAARAPGHG